MKILYLLGYALNLTFSLWFIILLLTTPPGKQFYQSLLKNSPSMLCRKFNVLQVMHAVLYIDF